MAENMEKESKKKKGCLIALLVPILLIVVLFLAFCICYIIETIKDKDELKFTLLDNDTYEVAAGINNVQEEIVIPSSYEGKPVTQVGDFSRKKLNSITIPNSVTSISNGAFKDAVNLSNITIPDSVTKIGVSAFYNTAYYNDENNWENGVLYVGNHLVAVDFDKELGYYEVKENTKTIAAAAFSDTKDTFIAHEACQSLYGINIPDSVVVIGDYAFKYCQNLKIVSIGNGVEYIGEEAFRDCKELNKVTLGTNIKYIGSNAFECYSGLQEVHINDLATWCNIEFANQKANPVYNGDTKLYFDGAVITDLVIPEGITSVKDYAFYNCYFLKTITIPTSVQSIGRSAFYCCTGLTNIVLPEGMETIAENAFEYCFRVKSITLPKSLKEINRFAFEDCTTLIEIVNHSTLPLACGSSEYGKIALNTKVIRNDTSKVDNQDGYLFYTVDDVNYLLGYVGDDSLLTLPEYYQGKTYRIYKESFEFAAMESLVIPAGVTEIETEAFHGCKNLTNVTIGKNVTSICEYAFLGCNNLEMIDFEIPYGWQERSYYYPGFQWKNCIKEYFTYNHKELIRQLVRDGSSRFSLRRV